MACPHRGHGILCDLEHEMLTVLDERKQAFSCARGDTLFEEGEPIKGLYYIVTGRFKLYKTGDEGDRTITRLAGPGDMLGYDGVFEERGYRSTAEAVEDAKVCHIDRLTFQRLALSTPAVYFSAAQRLGKELGETEKMLFAVGLGSVASRLAGWLVNLHGEGAEPHIDLPLTREEIAQLLGTTPETVMRMLSQLQSEGMITVAGRRVGVVDRRRLETLARTPS